MAKKNHKADRFEARKKLYGGLSDIIINKDLVIEKIKYLKGVAEQLKVQWEENEVDALDLAELEAQIEYFDALLEV